MYGTSRFNLLVVALITLVSFVTARTVITSQTCATRYCDHYVPNNKIYKTTKTIHKSTRYTKVRWKTVTKPKSTFTVERTKTITQTRTSTISTVVIVTTTWTKTVTHTHSFTVTSPSSTVTLPVTTTTISSTLTVAPPAGFVGVNDDPDNKVAQRPPWRRRDVEQDLNGELERRDAEPEPEPAAKAEYVTAVTCTKVLITKTGTSDLWKTTTKSTGTTTKTVWKTKTVLAGTKTITKPGAKTIRQTVSLDKDIFVSTTSTVLSGVTTKYQSTVSSHLPVETFHDACWSRNQSPRPYMRQGLGWAAYQMGPDPDENVYEFQSNGTAYDCCRSCHTWSEGGVCIGSVWRYNVWGGDPWCEDDPDCEIWIPEFLSTCKLIIAASDSPAMCRQHGYNFYSLSTEYETAVSNGLGCRRFKFGKWFT